MEEGKTSVTSQWHNYHLLVAYLIYPTKHTQRKTNASKASEVLISKRLKMNMGKGTKMEEPYNQLLGSIPK